MADVVKDLGLCNWVPPHHHHHHLHHLLLCSSSNDQSLITWTLNFNVHTSNSMYIIGFGVGHVNLQISTKDSSSSNDQSLITWTLNFNVHTSNSM
jgi:hypothetical protein